MDGISRGTVHLSFSLWGVTVTVIRWMGWRNYTWNRIENVGGCWIARIGPVVVTVWGGK